MEWRWRFLRQCNDDFTIMLSKVKGTLNPADTMTKALPYDSFIMYRKMLGVLSFTEAWEIGNHGSGAEIEGAAIPHT